MQQKQKDVYLLVSVLIVFQTIISDLEQLGLAPKILQVEQYKRKGILTKKQDAGYGLHYN